jgi:hypothetical protein
MGTSLAAALDASIDAMLEHGASLRECLDTWPEYRAELEWLLPVVAQLSSPLLRPSYGLVQVAPLAQTYI